ncbi:EspA/EspE family type VII secretion system effector [Mycobacterium florentinum]|uniref:EspA/EspE family type VII secretion system effector n=1 Tax=Mycobacterium florentinum TaxID=292462 RepID=UPI00111C748A|nr:EspA/EspE family type VII secretion system effector [Mycobacterium florentinum]
MKDSGTKALPTPTAIVDAAALAVTIVDLLNGFGTPNSGSAVSTAADKLNLFLKDLDPASIPDPRDWSGDAATAYIGQVNTLKGFVDKFKTYDQTLKGYLSKQAGEVKQAHLCCTVNVAVLTAAAGIALAMYLIPIAGPGISQAWQIIAAFACCAAVFVVEMLTLSSSMGISNQCATLGQQYVQLGKDVTAQLAGSFGRIQGKVASDTSSKLSGFRAVSDGLTDYSFASATPSVNKLAAAAGDKVAPEQKALLESSSDKAAAAKTTDTKKDTTTKTGDKTPAPAAFTPPSLAQIGQASQGLNQVGQTLGQGMQQIQSLAQSAKGSAPAAAPVAAHDVSDVKDDEDKNKEDDAKKDGETGAAAGAAAGKDGGTERAPVDAAAPAAAPAGAGRERVV